VARVRPSMYRSSGSDVALPDAFNLISLPLSMLNVRLGAGPDHSALQHLRSLHRLPRGTVSVVKLTGPPGDTSLD
jgi:hypothetical protein